MLEILNSIKNSASTNYKQELLFAYLSDASVEEKHKELLMQLFNIQFNYNLNTYLTDLNKFEKSCGGLTLVESLYQAVHKPVEGCPCDLFRTLVYDKSVRGERHSMDSWRSALLMIALSLKTTVDLRFILDAITGSLTVGMSIKGFNKVIAGLRGRYAEYEIPEFECMKASKLEDASIDFSQSYTSVKKDGVNCSAYSGKFFTRNGGDILLPHMQDEIFSVFKYHAVFGELVSTSRQSSSGIVNSALKLGLSSRLDVSSLKLHIFDIVPIENFRKKEFGGLPFKDRVEILESFKNGTTFEILQQHRTTSLEEVMSLNDLYYSQGEEGVICNDANGLFELKRSKLRAKVKAEIDGDFKIVDCIPHKRNSEWVGAFTITDATGRMICNVGSGFSDEERELFWKTKETLIGSICTVKYNSVDAKNNTLFIPIFKCLRADKNEADII